MPASRIATPQTSSHRTSFHSNKWPHQGPYNALMQDRISNLNFLELARSRTKTLTSQLGQMKVSRFLRHFFTPIWEELLLYRKALVSDGPVTLVLMPTSNLRKPSFYESMPLRGVAIYFLFVLHILTGVGLPKTVRFTLSAFSYEGLLS